MAFYINERYFNCSSCPYVDYDSDHLYRCTVCKTNICRNCFINGKFIIQRLNDIKVVKPDPNGLDIFCCTEYYLLKDINAYDILHYVCSDNCHHTFSKGIFKKYQNQDELNQSILALNNKKE